MSENFRIAEKKEDLTATEMIDQLKTIGVLTTATKKDKVWSIYQENLDKLKAQKTTWLNCQSCLIKAFGDHGTSRLCAKCKSKQIKVYEACAQAKADQTKATTEKRSGTTKKKTATGLWGTRKGSLTHTYCQFLFNAGENGIEMADAKYADWNRKCQTFYDITKKLINKGYVRQDGKRFFVTQAGIEDSPTG